MHRRPTGQPGHDTTTSPRRRGLRALLAALALVTAMVAMTLPSGAEDATAPADTTTTTNAPDTTVPTVETTTSTTEPAGTTGTTVDTPPSTDAPTETTVPATTIPAPTEPAASETGAPAAVSVPAAASITVTPSTLLVQGDTVTVAGSGFPGNSLVGIIQCRLPTAGVQDCNMSSLAYTNTDSAGTFSTSYTPRRILYVAGSPTDCAVADACKIGVGDVNDQSITADYPIQFDPAIPPPPPPTLVVTPSTDLLNGQTVTVTGTDYPANSMVALIECLDPPTTDPFNCSYSTATYTMSDGFGSIATPMAVRRIVRFDGTSTDCATAGACVILSAVQEIGDGATASIQFDGSVPPPPPPSRHGHPVERPARR